MAKRKKRLHRFGDLTWDDLSKWAGSRIVSRGRSYQKQGRVSELAATEDGGLIAWVEGSERYAARVLMGEDGLPDSICTCPYESDCKHGVAVVLEYLERVDNNRAIPEANKDDKRLALLRKEEWDDEADDDEPTLHVAVETEIETLLMGKTKAELIELVHHLAEQHREIAQDLADRRLLASGDIKALVTRLRREIEEIGDEIGWQNHWSADGHTPDYSRIRAKLETLLKAGHADEVLALGEELLTVGAREVEESHDEGETAAEIAGCVPIIVEALEQSSLESVDKLVWAIDVVMDDGFGLCKAVAQYLTGHHKKADWSLLADVLLERSRKLKPLGGTDAFSRDYARDRLGDWVIHALEQAGRTEEIIPLCEIEAPKTGSYDRLVKRLIAARRYEDAERWIQEGIRATEGKWPGIAGTLRDRLREVRSHEENWPAMAAIQADEFVRHPSRKTFADCKKASGKVNAWPEVRKHLLDYLEKGELPWKQKDWPLPETSLAAAGTEPKDRFPMLDHLIGIAILEKRPDQVLHWYDQLPKRRFRWHGGGEDQIATAVRTHAPDRAVAIWKSMAERSIAQAKPSAYRGAVDYLRKAGQVMARQERAKEWDGYLDRLRGEHARKRRLMEILDGLAGKPIVKRRR